MANIHPTAVVSPLARIGHDVTIGPFCVVEDDVHLGDGCRVESHAVIRQGTYLGENNHICEAAKIGALPQHTNCPASVGTVRIGCHNVLREGVTVHRAMAQGDATTIGDGNYLMVNAHVGHDVVLGNRIVVVNNVLVGGHASIGDQAYLGGASAMHQFCRVGRLAMVAGMGRISKDVPPYVTVDHDGLVVGLNLIGLRRAGYINETIAQLKAAYRLIYRSGLPWQQMLAELAEAFVDPPAADFHAFFSGGSRAFVTERRQPRTLKLHEADDDLRARAG